MISDSISRIVAAAESQQWEQLVEYSKIQESHDCRMSDSEKEASILWAADTIATLQVERDRWQKDCLWNTDQYANCATRLKEAKARVEELEAMIHEATEVYAGMEGFIPETAAEGYCLRIIRQMYSALIGGEDDSQ